MKTVLFTTEDFIKLQHTFLSIDVAAGSSVVLTVPNSDGIVANKYVVVGYEGSEQAELCKVTAVSATSITVQTLKLAHKADEPITLYRYNQRKFYGCLTATGTFVELTTSGSPADIQVGDPQGAYLEYVGSEGYLYFKSTYYNSTSLEETPIADAVAVLSNDSLHYTSLYNIKRQAGLLVNPYITDGIVDTYRKRAENEVKSYIATRYTMPLAEVPSIIENVTTLLAAGYMDYQEFGKDGEGVKWLAEARAILRAITKGAQRLFNSSDVELAYPTAGNQVKSYPDQVDNTNGPARVFTMGQRF